MTDTHPTHARRTRSLACLLAGLCVAGACRKTPDAPKPVSPDVWAVVDGREIRRDDVEKAYHSAIDPAATPAPSDIEALTAKLNVVDELVTQELLLARAKALGVDVTDAEVEAAVTERKSGAPDDVFQQQLKQRGLNADDLKRGVRRELVVQKLLDREVTAKITIADQEVSDFYNQNRAQFSLNEPQYRLAQIVVTAGRDPQLRNRMNDDAGTPAEAGRKVAMLVERLRGGADFGALARDFSEDPQSLAQGGDLGFVPASALSRVAPQLRDAVLKMAPGSVSTVTIGPNATIVALVAREPAGQRDLTTPGVKDGILNLLKGRKLELLRTAYIAAARGDAKVTNYLARQVIEAQGKAPASLVPAAPGKQP